MRLATTTDGTLGAVEDDGFLPLRGELLDHLRGEGGDPAGPPRPLGSVDLGPPLRPPTVVAVGLNYRQHASEVGLELPTAPLLFAKLGSSVIGPGDAIVTPPGDVQLDFEAELAVVIGKGGRDIPVEAALDHVGGYTCCNDVSERRAQMGDGQWLRGKSYDTFAPLGPVLVTADEVPDPQALRIRCLVNGEVRQDSTTADMVFGVAELVAYCSRCWTLRPGDVIATGTPAGVAMSDGRWLRPGDTVSVEIEGIGTLTNPVA